MKLHNTRNVRIEREYIYKEDENRYWNFSSVIARRWKKQQKKKNDEKSCVSKTDGFSDTT